MLDLFFVSMRVAVHFDYKLSVLYKEDYDIWTNWMLTSHLETKLPSAQSLPENFFKRRKTVP